MSNQLAGAEKMKSASVRVHADLLDDFDTAVDESARWDSRSEAIRDFIETVVDNPEIEETDGRVPPDDDDLAAAYDVLCSLTLDGYVTEDRVLTVLSQKQGMQKDLVRQTLIIPLVKRGYAKRMSNVAGDTAVKALR
jgi:Arc/MetJ-type ribon-helix-helix transcriptional regulator